MGGDSGTRRDQVTPTAPKRKRSPPSPDPDCVIVDLSRVNLNVSEKWRKRLKELDDYQRSAPFVFGRLTLG